MAKDASHKEIIDDHERRLEELRRRFDLYFQGFERTPPTDRRDSIRAAFIRLREGARRWSTGDRFKINTLHQKFITYDRMWERQLKQLEEGTHRRDKARRRRERREEEQRPAAAATNGAPAKRAPARASESLDDAKMEKIYSVYMQAKKRTGERTNLTMDGLKRQLAKQVPVIKKKHGCKDVDFKVVLKNGKAMLKAIPK